MLAAAVLGGDLRVRQTSGDSMMAHIWTWEEIADDWLRGARIPALSEVVVDAFNRADRLLGSDWLESRRQRSGARVYGSAPTLAVVSIGRKLQALEKAKNGEGLLARIRTGDRAAFSELTGVFLCRDEEMSAEVEIAEPVTVSAGKNPKVPDFRLRREGAEWTYVEVTAPDVSEMHQDAQRVLDQLAACLQQMPSHSSVEVFLRRKPTREEVNSLEQEVAAIATAQGPATKDFPGLALLLANETPPGQVVVSDHGEPAVPRVGASRGVVEGGVPLKHITVRVPFSDERADTFLATEAKQLPKEYPGLILVDVRRAPSALSTWEDLLRRRLQPTIHTRVGAVCLFMDAIVLTGGGETSKIGAKVIINEHARKPAPQWILDNLKRHTR